VCVGGGFVSRVFNPLPYTAIREMTELARSVNPLPVQFKSLLPGQEGCVFFSGHLNTCTCYYVLLR
jgi:hypothetical protein